eukprot:g7405.t1
MRRLRGVTEKLEEKLAQFQEEKLELERKQRRVNKSIEESAKEHAELTSMREKILEKPRDASIGRDETTFGASNVVWRVNPIELQAVLRRIRTN